MATLSEKINKNKSILKQSQGLFETTGESLMSRIRDRGLAPGAGTSPLAASGLGAGPDVAKMAGTGAQMDRAIRESISPDKRPREPQARMFLTEEEKQEKQRAQQLSNLDRLGERIGTIVNQAVSSAQVTNVFRVDVQEDIVKSTYPDLTEEQRNNFQQILAEITYDENGQPQITEDIVGRLNASLPADATPLTVESVKPFITSGQLQFNKTKAKDTYPDITDEQLTALEKIVAADDFNADEIKKDELNIVAEILGIDKNNIDEIIGKIKELITPISDTVVDNITSTLGPAVSLSSLTTEDWQAFGLSSAQDLANLIGLESDEIQDMTIGDLQKRIDALMMADYDRVDELTRVANDPFYPEALRKAAKAELRDLSSVGVIATESDFSKLNEAVQSADELEIAGKTYTTEELLSDENLTVMIATYLEDPESDYSKDLLKDFPALVEFITGNKAALEDAMKYLDEKIKDKIAISKKNDELNKYAPEEGVDIDLTGVNKAILGADFEEGVFSDTQMSEGEFTIGEGDDAITYYHQANLRGENAFNKEDKRAYAEVLSKTANNPIYKDLFDELATQSADAIWTLANNLGLNVANYINRRYTQVTNQNTLDTAIANVATNPNAPQQALEQIFGGKDKLQELVGVAKQGNIFSYKITLSEANIGQKYPNAKKEDIDNLVKIVDASDFDIDNISADALKLASSIFGIKVTDKDKIIAKIKELTTVNTFGEKLSKDAQELVDNFIFNPNGTVNYQLTAEKLAALNKENGVLKEAGLTAVLNKTDIVSATYNTVWNLVKDGELSQKDVDAILATDDSKMIDKIAEAAFIKAVAKGKDVGELPKIVQTYYNTKVNEDFVGTELDTYFKDLFGDKFKFSSDTKGVYDLDSVAADFTWIIDSLGVESPEERKKLKIYTWEGGGPALDPTWKKREEWVRTTLPDIISKLKSFKTGKPTAVKALIDAKIKLYEDIQVNFDNLDRTYF